MSVFEQVIAWGIVVLMFVVAPLVGWWLEHQKEDDPGPPALIIVIKPK
jgi:hypothetical protein